MRKFILAHMLVVFLAVIFSEHPWPFALLTVAQLLYVPVLLRLVCKESDWFWKGYPYIAVPAYASVIWIAVTGEGGIQAAVYLLFTLYFALYGFYRFLNRGFTNMEEFAIDAGMVYLAMGGAWYFAYVQGIDLGFSPLLTWLTAIHFHYSAFILPIFVGLAGRLLPATCRAYKRATAALLVAPMAVAVGITFSKWIEIISVVLYVYGVFVMIHLSWKQVFSSILQKWLVLASFATLSVTLTFSMLYVLSNGFGMFSLTIDFMLRFHGIFNCICFALLGIAGWILSVPPPTYRRPSFPVSGVRGRQSAETIGKAGEHRGLSDNLRAYEIDLVSEEIIHFYENTIDYRMKAVVKWHRWFKPFAYIYSFISRRTQQINLPFSSRKVEMTGSILTVEDMTDGRENVRIWERKIGEETAFTSLYSQHRTNGRLYMNIALPLPFTTMTGVLELHAAGDDLHLTSRRRNADSDAGVYLSVGRKDLFKLPLQEDFLIKNVQGDRLSAKHRMWIFSLPFLTIDYEIQRRE